MKIKATFLLAALVLGLALAGCKTTDDNRDQLQQEQQDRGHSH